MSFLILVVVAALIGGAIGNARRRSGGPERELQDLRDRMQRLEQSLETMTADMERVSDGQRFLTALLEDRGRTQSAIRSPAPPASAASSAPADPPGRSGEN